VCVGVRCVWGWGLGGRGGKGLSGMMKGKGVGDVYREDRVGVLWVGMLWWVRGLCWAERSGLCLENGFHGLFSTRRPRRSP